MIDNYDSRKNQAVGLAKGKKPMPTTEKTLRVLVVDDDRDGADALACSLKNSATKCM